MSDDAEPKILGGRYALTSEVRKGGMSTVTKAADLKTGKFVAIKQMLPGGDEKRARESIGREYKALETLRHPNIVSLIEADKSTGDETFLVLEWLDKTLEEVILSSGPLTWSDYFERFGKRLIEAVAFAHRRGWIHRDIKPKNILLTEAGIPKISDYGIARFDVIPSLGITFGHFRSEPYTPQESDDGRYSNSRDCFSLAAVSVFCLSGKELHTYPDLYARLADLDPTIYPRGVLEVALSTDPPLRHQLASHLLADIDGFEKARQKAARAHLEITLSLSSSALESIERQIGERGQSLIEGYLLSEVNDVSAVTVVDTGGELRYRVYGVTWVLEAKRTDTGAPMMLVERAYRMWPSELERIRQGASEVGVEFTFAAPTDWALAARTLEEMTARIALDLQEKDKSIQRYQSEQVFRSWYNLLRARNEFEVKRQSGIAYELIERQGLRALVQVSTPLSEDLIGQSRLIRTGLGRIILCDVVDIQFDEITVAITLGDADDFPRHGQLEVNTFAEERALEKQRQALDAVYYERAASNSLKSLVAFPAKVEPATAVSEFPLPIKGDFGEDKVEVLGKALALRDLMVVKGPPGTGKTRLIEELILQYLVKFPEHRILLSSQTHIALDNVLERVIARNPNIDIVRIGRQDDSRISAICRPLMLDRKVEVWAEKVRKNAEQFLKKWAAEHGLNKDEADTAIVAERLFKVIQIRRALEVQLAESERSVQDVRDTREKQLGETGSTESQRLDREAEEIATRQAELTTAIAKAKRSEQELRNRLGTMSEYGKDLAERSAEEVKEWIEVLLGNGEHENKYRELLELQEDWLMRVGRSSDFFAAAMSSAKIVAGTCIGLAGVRGFSEVAYDLCILDEASKATATEALVPMARSRRWILVGDPEQLPPFLDSEFARGFEEIKELEVRETLLDRFVRLLPRASVAELTTQHRMVKDIGDLISHCFYRDSLKSIRQKPEIGLNTIFKKSVVWLSTSEVEGRRERPTGSSFENQLECRIIRDTLGRIDFIVSKKKQRCKVAVMAGYVAQVKAIKQFIRDHLHRWSSLDVTCNTVDAFQGQQADVCIYSVARSNSAGRLGFLREKPRLNVALSRARDWLIIVGDSRFCEEAEGENPFRSVIRYMHGHQETCEVRLLNEN